MQLGTPLKLDDVRIRRGVRAVLREVASYAHDYVNTVASGSVDVRLVGTSFHVSSPVRTIVVDAQGLITHTIDAPVLLTESERHAVAIARQNIDLATGKITRGEITVTNALPLLGNLAHWMRVQGCEDITFAAFQLNGLYGIWAGGDLGEPRLIIVKDGRVLATY